VVLFCAGKGFTIDKAWESWMEDNDLHDVYYRILLDYKMTGNAYLEMVTDSKKSFLKFYHQDSTKVRRKTEGGFMLHPDWNKYTMADQKSKYLPEYPLFKKGKDKFMHSLIQIKDYEPEFMYYGIPNWYAGLKSAIIDSQINTWNKERLENKFSIDAILAIPGVDTPEEERQDFFLYVDEFQNFATPSFANILSEARKYRLALIMAHQYIGQLTQTPTGQQNTKIRDAVFGNVGTMMSFKVGADDGEYLAKEYAPTLSQQDIIGIANYKAYVKLNINNTTSRPFSMETIYDMENSNQKIADIVKKYSRLKYGRKKVFVDQEIEGRLGIME
jgi:hypothetical protein